MLLNCLIRFWLLLTNFFKRGNYYCIQLSQVYWIASGSCDSVIRDYHDYVEHLISRSLSKVVEPCIVIFNCDFLMPFSHLLPIRSIRLQIEHTLVKPGARDSDDAIAGVIEIPNSSNHYMVRIVNSDLLLSSDLIFDYSRINLFNIFKAPYFDAYSKKLFCISPALYKLEPACLIRSNKRSINTITLFGNPNEPRRKKFIADLEIGGVKSQNINNIFSGIEGLYRNTKILINIHQTDHHDTLEELRVLPALRCGVIVISEKSPLVELTGYSKYIIWGELSELPAIIFDVQSNYEKWHQKIFNNPGFISRMNRISRRNELVAMKAIELLNKL